MANDLTESDLDAIEAKYERATPGPWRWWTSNSFRRLSSDATRKDGDVLHSTIYRDGHPGIEVRNEDMALIQDCRTDIPRLVRALREAWAVIKELRGRPVYTEWEACLELAKHVMADEHLSGAERRGAEHVADSIRRLGAK